jgi:hypothetical protein
MSANRARNRRKHKQQSSTLKTIALRLGGPDQSGNGRVRQLVDLASSLMRLKSWRDKALPTSRQNYKTSTSARD